MKKKPVSSRNQLGFTILEALVAVVIMGFGILSIAGMQASMSRNADNAKQRTEAVRLAQEKIETFRSYTGIISTLVGQSSTSSAALNWDALTNGTEIINSNSANAIYTRNWTFGGNFSDSMRGLTINVIWTDRAGDIQTISLSSIVSKIDPAYSGFLGFPLPLNTNLKRPKNRSIDIPIPAISINNTGHSYISWNGSTGGYLVFNDTSGDIVQKCSVLPTAASIPTAINLPLPGCTQFNGYLLTGYITGDSALNVNLVSKIVVPFNNQKFISDTPECSVGIAFDQNNGTAIANTKYYACLIEPTDDINTISTTRVWSGRIDLAGVTSTSLAGTYTCRFTTDADTGVNDNHPAIYSSVDKSLDNQNFYISRSVCASTNLFRVAHLTNTTTSNLIPIL